MSVTNNTLAVVFPGQGAQAVGMVRDLAAIYPQVRARYAQASAVLGYDLWTVVDEGPVERLNQTDCTQPALLTASAALWDIWQHGATEAPCVAAGHSFGEYSALVCSGALEFDAAVSLVAERGRFMQQCVPAGAGAMVAVLGLDADAVAAVCKEASGDQIAECANLNAPEQIVVAGDATAIARVAALAKDKGAKRVVPLSVSVPAHCALMRSAADKFAALIADVAFTTPSFPVIHNVDVATHGHAADIRRVLVAQLSSPVRWAETVAYFERSGITTVLECGPGNVLSLLIKRTARSIKCFSLGTIDGIQAAREHL